MSQCFSSYQLQRSEGFSIKAKKLLFNAQNISTKLDFDIPKYIYQNRFEDHIRQISISGVQVKYSLRLENRVLVLTEKSGQYMLKPIPLGRFLWLDQAPENEHLTMQIAQQIFGIETALNTLIYLQNGEPAYLVKRFDLREDGLKFLQEDFAQIKQVSSQNGGKNYKYDGSYEEIAALIRKYCATWQVQIERFYRLVVFNYLFSNGDAHLKNFSLLETTFGDFCLSPAYDLLCTSLHTPNETPMALDLFADDYYTDAYNVLGFYSYDDFYEFGIKIGISEIRVRRALAKFLDKSEQVESMVKNSFLSDACKMLYWTMFEDRIRALNTHSANTSISKSL